MPEKGNDVSELLEELFSETFEEERQLRERFREITEDEERVRIEEAIREGAEKDAYGTLRKALENAGITPKVTEWIMEAFGGFFTEIQDIFSTTAEKLWRIVNAMADACGAGIIFVGECTPGIEETRRQEVRERRDAEKRFERENRAKMKQYRQFQAGNQRLRRTGKRYREWRGPERQGR